MSCGGVLLGVSSEQAEVAQGRLWKLEQALHSPPPPQPPGVPLFPLPVLW